MIPRFLLGTYMTSIYLRNRKSIDFETPKSQLLQIEHEYAAILAIYFNKKFLSKSILKDDQLPILVSTTTIYSSTTTITYPM